MININNSVQPLFRFQCTSLEGHGITWEYLDDINVEHCGYLFNQTFQTILIVAPKIDYTYSMATDLSQKLSTMKDHMIPFRILNKKMC